MGLLLTLPFLILFTILIATAHLRKVNSRLKKTISSITLILLIPFILDVHSSHLCNEGGAPLFVKYGFGVLGAILPWVNPRHPWLTRALIIPIIVVGTLTARHLTASYHRDDITGNPYYSVGKFWHTPFTGQYVRESESERESREAESERIRNM